MENNSNKSREEMLNEMTGFVFVHVKQAAHLLAKAMFATDFNADILFEQTRKLAEAYAQEMREKYTIEQQTKYN